MLVENRIAVVRCWASLGQDNSCYRCSPVSCYYSVFKHFFCHSVFKRNLCLGIYLFLCSVSMGWKIGTKMKAHLPQSFIYIISILKKQTALPKIAASISLKMQEKTKVMLEGFVGKMSITNCILVNFYVRSRKILFKCLLTMCQFFYIPAIILLSLLFSSIIYACPWS